jgi:hypothetical protein
MENGAGLSTGAAGLKRDSDQSVVEVTPAANLGPIDPSIEFPLRKQANIELHLGEVKRNFTSQGWNDEAESGLHLGQ